MEIKIKKLSETAIIPIRGSTSAAGRDLYADLKEEQVIIKPHETEMVPTNIAIEIPEGYFGGIYARSGLATKQGLRPANCVGIVDSDYRGNIFVALHNDTNENQIIKNHYRIGQLVIQTYLSYCFIEVDVLDSTDRDIGGFGSTGR